MVTSTYTRRLFFTLIGLVLATAAMPGYASVNSGPTDKPNIIVIFIDDMGYGDLGCFGSEKNRTPHIDKMADEGMTFTDFYVACSVCTPSRAALLTGCYPRRVNLHVDEKNLCVLFPGARKGLNPKEITIAEILKAQGYNTACIGKWHLGDHPDFLPTKQGFDHYYGIPYSNDMNRKNIPLPLMRDEKVIEAPVKQQTITQRYTEEAIEFIRHSKGTPFFLYLPHAMVHLPLHASKDFKGKSANGIYGDATEEIDWSTGQILKTLKTQGIDDNTLVIFTSDNGSTGRNGGSNVPLRGNKGRTDEGGMRVPCIMRFPGKIPAQSTCSELCATIDFLPTLATLAGAEVPKDRIIDGKNISQLMTEGDAKSPHEAFYYYQMDQLQCVRSGKWKLHLPMDSKKRNWGKPEGESSLKLFDLKKDIHEDQDVSAQHPEVVKRLLNLAEGIKHDIGHLEQKGVNQRPAGWVETPQPRLINKRHASAQGDLKIVNWNVLYGFTHDKRVKYSCPSPITIPKWSQTIEEVESKRQRIDFIFADKALQQFSTSGTILKSKELERISDHYPVVVEFKVPVREKGEWIQLFNGEDIDDWIVKLNHHEINDNYRDTFRVEDGILKVRYDQYEDFGERFGHLYFKQPFSHYHLAVEYRFVGQLHRGAPGYAILNSGVMIHSQDPKTILRDQNWPISIELQFLAGLSDGRPRGTGNVCTPGTHVFHNGKLTQAHIIQSSAETYKPEEWVRAEAIVRGNGSIVHQINGKKVLEYSQPQIGGGVVSGYDPNIFQTGKALSQGFIALQSEGQPVDFRKVELKVLKPDQE